MNPFEEWWKEAKEVLLGRTIMNIAKAAFKAGMFCAMNVAIKFPNSMTIESHIKTERDKIN